MRNLSLNQRELDFLNQLIVDYTPVAFKRKRTLPQFLSLRKKVIALRERIQKRELITIEGAALRARVSRRTVYNWLGTGRLEYVKVVSGKIRIYEDSLFKAVERRTEQVIKRKKRSWVKE